jgi:hypothetical protein
MPEESFRRKLTTMFSADVAEYSRLMGQDEAGTVKTLKAYRGIMTELIRQHQHPISLYDYTGKACYDGLTQHGRNANQGAESIISFQLANLTLWQQRTLKSLGRESALHPQEKPKSTKRSKRQ